MTFKVEKVDKIPKGFRTGSQVYFDLIEYVSKQPVGTYLVTIENKKTTTIYQTLAKLLKDRKDMELHKVKDQIFIQRLATDKPLKK